MKRDNRSKPAEEAVPARIETWSPIAKPAIEVPESYLAEQREAERQRFIDAAAIAFHHPGVPGAKAFRLADELWAARVVYLREVVDKR